MMLPMLYCHDCSRLIKPLFNPYNCNDLLCFSSIVERLPHCLFLKVANTLVIYIKKRRVNVKSCNKKMIKKANEKHVNN